MFLQTSAIWSCKRYKCLRVSLNTPPLALIPARHFPCPSLQLFHLAFPNSAFFFQFYNATLHKVVNAICCSIPHFEDEGQVHSFTVTVSLEIASIFSTIYFWRKWIFFQTLFFFTISSYKIQHFPTAKWRNNTVNHIQKDLQKVVSSLLWMFYQFSCSCLQWGTGKEGKENFTFDDYLTFLPLQKVFPKYKRLWSVAKYF